jgi:hypothetical protein
MKTVKKESRMPSKEQVEWWNHGKREGSICPLPFFHPIFQAFAISNINLIRSGNREDLISEIWRLFDEVNKETLMGVFVSWAERLRWAIQHKGKYFHKSAKDIQITCELNEQRAPTNWSTSILRPITDWTWDIIDIGFETRKMTLQPAMQSKFDA